MLSPSQLPPSPFIRELAPFVGRGGLNVLDVGCNQGRNALYLAGLGNSVIGLSLEHNDLVHAQAEADRQSLAANFINADARAMPFRSGFDIVVCTEVLHQIPIDDRKSVVREIQDLTKPGGFNAISDYFGVSDKALEPFWLRDLYPASAWDICSYYEEEPRAVMFNEAELVLSKALLVAVKR